MQNSYKVTPALTAEGRCGSAIALAECMRLQIESEKPVCIIPARGGSKRIPRKNIKLFCGKPMIQWSIEAAQRAECFERIIVSTDCAQISEVAKACGAQVPFMRPAELSDDYTITATVIKHAITTLSSLQIQAVPGNQAVCCLYATAPFVLATDIVHAFELMQSSEFVMPVTRFAFPIQRAAKMTDQGRLVMFQPEQFRTRSQDLEDAWHDTGQFYWATADAWCSDQSPFEIGATAYPIPRWRVQDIDTTEDWQRAELMFSALAQQ